MWLCSVQIALSVSMGTVPCGKTIPAGSAVSQLRCEQEGVCDFNGRRLRPHRSTLRGRDAPYAEVRV